MSIKLPSRHGAAEELAVAADLCEERGLKLAARALREARVDVLDTLTVERIRVVSIERIRGRASDYEAGIIGDDGMVTLRAGVEYSIIER
jgi:hypothetical protein